MSEKAKIALAIWIAWGVITTTLALMQATYTGDFGFWTALVLSVTTVRLLRKPA